MSQVVRTAFDLYSVSDADGRVSYMFKHVFIEHNCVFSYINSGSYIQFSVSSASGKKEGALVLTETNFDVENAYVLPFHLFCEPPTSSEAAEGCSELQDWNANFFRHSTFLQCMEEVHGSRERWKLEQLYTVLYILPVEFCNVLSSSTS